MHVMRLRLRLGMNRVRFRIFFQNNKCDLGDGFVVVRQRMMSSVANCIIKSFSDASTSKDLSISSDRSYQRRTQAIFHNF